MTAHHRLRLAVIAADLKGLDRDPPHAARLARALARHPRPATTLADLEAAPQWLRAPAETRAALARKAALMLTAPHLARCIDGARLRATADAAGPQALDAAIALGTTRDPSTAPDIAPADLAATGHAILAATLSPALAALLPPATPIDPALAHTALADARAPTAHLNESPIQ